MDSVSPYTKDATITAATTSTTIDLSPSINMTFNPGTSTFIYNNSEGDIRYFDGGGLTYNNVTFNGDQINVLGNNTFNVLKINNAGDAAGIKFDDGSTQTATTVTGNGSSGNWLNYYLILLVFPLLFRLQVGKLSFNI